MKLFTPTVAPLLRLLASLALFLFASQAQAHPVPFSYLDLDLSEEKIEGAATVHLTDIAHELELDDPAILLDEGVLSRQYSRIGSILAERMEIGSGELPAPQWRSAELVDDDDAVRLSFVIDAPPPPALEVRAHFFSYDPVHQTFVNLYAEGELRQQWIFDADSSPGTHFSGSAAGVMAVIGTFVPSGIHHILIGPDHILFLIGLILLGGSLKRLAIIVTSFTIGHSVTLSLAATGTFMPPAWLIEPLIALSIVVVGADNLLRGEGKDLRAGIAFFFGLIHGFGFAFVLREFGLPDSSLAWSLLSFNVGVEIGQLAIVIVAALVLAAIRQRSERIARHIATFGSLAVIAAGAYWFVERVFLTGAA